MKVDRRSFLQFSGFTLAGAVLGKGTRKWILPHEKPYYASDGMEEWATSICRQCPAGCGIRVRKMDGWPVSIEGNPDCPISRGKLCPRGLNALQAQYNPSRVVGPLHRKNRQSSSWEKVSWDEAIRAVSSQLKQIRERGNAYRVVACLENTDGWQQQYLRRFFYTYGTNNVVKLSGIRDPGAAAAHFFTTGQKNAPAYDLKSAHFVLSVGTPLLEGWLSPTYVHRWYGDFRQGREHRGRFVQVEDRLSPTAAKADEWIPLRSGAEADFLLALAGTLILEGLYDNNFIQEHCTGFENWFDESGKEHEGFRELIGQHYPLDRTSELTGVSSTAILRLARELVLYRPSVVIAEQMDSTAGLKTVWASQCLNALLGNIGKQGGVLTSRPQVHSDFGDVHLEPTAERSLGNVRLDGARTGKESLTALSVSNLAQALVTDSPYSVEAILFFPGPPVQYFMNREKISPALSKVPLVVSFSPYLDEKSMDADWILPDACPLEKWVDVVPELPEAVPVHAVAQPVIEPILDVRDSVETIHLLAKGIGVVDQALPWTNSEELLKAGAQQIYSARRGQVYTTEFGGEWLAQMEAGGWWSPQHPDFSSFLEDLHRKGGWWDPHFRYEDWNQVFVRPSRRFEFFSVDMQKSVGNRQTFLAPFRKEKMGEQTLEAMIIPVFSLDHVPLSLQPFLLEITDQLQRQQWSTWAEIHPETARAWKVTNGDRIKVQGAQGAFTTIVVLYPGALPGQLNISAGMGVYPDAPWLAAFGADVAGDLGYRNDEILRIPAKMRAPVRIVKV